MPQKAGSNSLSFIIVVIATITTYVQIPNRFGPERPLYEAFLDGCDTLTQPSRP